MYLQNNTDACWCGDVKKTKQKKQSVQELIGALISRRERKTRFKQLDFL